MSECKGLNLWHNGSIANCESIESSLFYAEESVYEVIRIIDRVPLFLEDHLDRLEKSLKLRNLLPLSSREELSEAIKELINLSRTHNGNIKVSLNYSVGKGNTLVYFIEALYPDPSMYAKGVDAVLFNAVRENPQAKVSNYLLRSQIYDKLVRTGAYEAILVDGDKTLTEGSKSNIYFIRGNRVITAPDNRVLCGITRKYVIQTCQTAGINLEMRCLGVDELNSVDAVFLSGTSPHVLAIRTIGDFSYLVDNPILSIIATGYKDLVESYIKKCS